MHKSQPSLGSRLVCQVQLERLDFIVAKHGIPPNSRQTRRLVQQDVSTKDGGASEERHSDGPLQRPLPGISFSLQRGLGENDPRPGNRYSRSEEAQDEA